jgi:hypothetical protein
MSAVSRWLCSWQDKTMVKPVARPRRCMPALDVEALEDRVVPSGSHVLDLTHRGAEGSIGGALFHQGDLVPPGAGKLESIVRLEARRGSHVDQGYNTDYRPLQFNEVHSKSLTHAEKLSNVATVTVHGQVYREFVLEVEQSRHHPLVSLDELQIFVSNSSTLHKYNGRKDTLGGLYSVYDLESTGEHWIKLNTRLDGSNHVAMVALIPESAFAGADANASVYVYSKFGEHFGVQGGYEEWAVRSAPVVQPTGSVSGVIFQDQGHTGVFAAGDLLESGTVYLDTTVNGVTTTTSVTTTNGHFTFSGLKLGQKYTVRYVVPSNLAASSPSSVSVTLTAGSADQTVNFGEFDPNAGNS